MNLFGLLVLAKSWKISWKNLYEPCSVVVDRVREVGASVERRTERSNHRVQSTLPQEGHER